MTSIAVGTLVLVLVLGTVAPLVAGGVSVKGYFRRDGTYVMRTFPNTFDRGQDQFLEGLRPEARGLVTIAAT
jgi:hypothetical protein